jgi:hypothetical protein
MAWTDQDEKEYQSLKAQYEEIKSSLTAAPQKQAVSSQPKKSKLEIVSELAGGKDNFISSIKEIPGMLGRGGAVAARGVADLGIDPSGITPGDTTRQLASLMTPKKTASKLKEVGKETFKAASGDTKSLTPAAKQAAAYGEVAASALTMMAAPPSVPSAAGRVSKVGELVDDMAGVPKGSSFAILKSPSKFLSVFKSKTAVQEAYKKAVEAGELAAKEDLSSIPLGKLAASSKVTKNTSIVSKAKKFESLVDSQEGINNLSKETVRELTTFKQAVNDKIGMLKSQIQSKTSAGKSANHEVQQLAKNYEISGRVNKVLDKVAPLLRKADAMASDKAKVDPFRHGIKKMVYGANLAGAGTAIQQAYRAPVVMGELVEKMRNKLSSPQ